MKRWIITIAVVFAASSVVALALGFYPVLRVNGEWILQKTVEKRHASTERVFAVQGIDDVAGALEEGGGDLLLGILETLIDERLALQEATALVDNLDEEVRRRVDEAVKELDATSVIERVYGISFEDFREQVLEPAAIVDILRDELGEELLAARFEEMRLTADITVHIVPYRWEEGFLVPE